MSKVIIFIRSSTNPKEMETWNAKVSVDYLYENGSQRVTRFSMYVLVPEHIWNVLKRNGVISDTFNPPLVIRS